MQKCFNKFSDQQKMIILEREPLSKHTSYRAGGLAKYFILPENDEELIRSLEFCQRHGDFYIIGRGTNVLFSDRFYEGTVVSLENYNNFQIINDNFLVCGGGVLLWDAVDFSLGNGLGGMENLSGIPGSVGGAVFMNAGAFGTEVSDIVYSFKTITYDGKTIFRIREKSFFSYRHSNMENEIISEVTFSLDKNHFDMKRSLDVLKRRNEKQPLEYPSCGSVFKRPKDNYAGTLIENCGLKGFSFGKAVVSEKHANFIVNLGGASAEDIYRTIRYVKDTVFKKTGVLLEEEVKLINF